MPKVVSGETGAATCGLGSKSLVGSPLSLEKAAKSRWPLGCPVQCFLHLCGTLGTFSRCWYRPASIAANGTSP